jgi:BirA family biotin operon repressor/biotin-[acetyl-CoA-carboxylase] ligase
VSRGVAVWEGRTPGELKERWARPELYVFARLGSTNDRARRLADEGAPHGTVVLADEQSAGRGVGSHRWHSPRRAGLYLSMVLRPERPPNMLLLPLLAGVAAAQAVARLLGDVPVAVKWPNDLIVADRKAGGVLCEASWAGRSPGYVVVGVGVNVHQAPLDFPEPLRAVATSLDAAAGRTVSRLALADLLIPGIEARCGRLPALLDRELLREFDELDWLRGRRCALKRPDGSLVRGTAAGIAPDGALLFRPDRAPLERVVSGRVVVEELPVPDY